MKKTYFKLMFTLILSVLVVHQCFPQNGKTFWTKTTQAKSAQKELVFRKTEPIKAGFYQLDIEGLKTALQTAPNRKTFSGTSNLVIDFPTADNTFEGFRIKEAPIMEESLQNKYPEIRTYIGESIETPGTVIRFSITSQGLHTMSMSNNNGTQFIDPYTKNSNEYIVYSKRDLPILDEHWECGFVDDDTIVEEGRTTNFDAARNADDGMLRDFRLAVACTIEYSAFHWMAAGLTAADSEASKKAAVMAAIVVTINRNNQIYERDLSITMTLVANNDTIVFINSDNFNNDSAGTLINQSQTVIDGAIGSSNYDIGHTFSTGGGGLAQLNSPCTSGKARGITGLGAPVGDAYDIDYVAHEMGHQYGAPHTFNGDEGSCSGNGTASNAYEPGSGSTIMAYAGICAPQNVQGNSDAYFHQKSLQMIWDNVSSGNSQCANQTASGNSAPTANAGGNFIIPKLTPYMLTGSSTDTDGTTAHTYTWEQYDLGTTGLPEETNTAGPLVRSFEGTTNPTRFIPRMSDLLQNQGSTTWEKLASVARVLNFRLTVRDNDINGGQTAVSSMLATVDATSGPFAVTSQNALTSWVSGDTETITWDVAGTNAGSVNTPNVDILLSTDGGETYATTLATAVTNNGSYNITVPNILAENCRVMVKGNGNIFFNINTARIAIGYSFTESCTTYSFDINQTLGTNATAFEFFDQSVTDSGDITDVNVKYDITSSNLSQLHMAMLSPNNTRAYLYAAGPCTATDGSANMQVTFDDEAGSAITCGTDPLTGIATPANIATPEPLSGIDGEDMNGQWRFMVANIGSSNMIFNTVDLEICTLVATLLNVTEFNLENSFTVFPNPNNGEFTVKFNGAREDVNIQVVDIRGRSIISKSYTNSSAEFNQTINLGNVQSGMYLLNVKMGSKTITKKIIVE